MFKYKKDAELVVEIQNTTPVLKKERSNGDNKNPCGVSFKQGLFNMSSDSHLFKKSEEIDQENKEGPYIHDSGNLYYPLYESKLCGQFTHRHATFEDIPTEDRYRTHAGTNNASSEELKNPNWIPQPRYYVKEEDVKESLNLDWDYEWFIGFRNAISAVADARSVKFWAMPRYGVGHSIPLIFTNLDSIYSSVLMANFNTFIIDYVTRQKASGGNLTFYIVRQLPIIPPKNYSDELILEIIPRVLELSYTSWDMIKYADDIWNEADEKLRDRIQEQWRKNESTLNPINEMSCPNWINDRQTIDDNIPIPPFVFGRDRRKRIQAEIDAVYAQIYSLDRDDLDHILDSFPIVKQNDLDEYGRYRTKDLIIENMK